MWTLNPSVAFLNHGSFGACPSPVLAYQNELRKELEQEPVHFFVRTYEKKLEEVRSHLAQFVGTHAKNLVFVTNATTGVNAVLRSAGLKSGDEILITDHTYNACHNAAQVVATQVGATIKVVPIPFLLQDPGEVSQRILDAISPRTRLVMLDHITSPTALIFPIREVGRELALKNIPLLVDGAHAPGMIPLHLDDLGVPFYTANCHKWICAPKGAAFLYVHPEHQAEIRPLAISHGHNSPRTDKSKFQLEFDWVGTTDPTPWLSIGKALSCMASYLPGGWPAIMEHNHALVLEGRDILCQALDMEPPVPAHFLGSMASLPLPWIEPTPLGDADPWHQRLWEEFRMEVPVFPWPSLKTRFLRISAQLYNHKSQYEALAQAIATLKA